MNNEINYEISPAVSLDLGNSVILSLEYSNNTIFALGDNGAWCVEPSGSLLSYVDWSNQYLKGYAFSENAFFAVLLSTYRAGSQSNLQVVSADGASSNSLSFSEQILSLDTSGNYLSVLTGNRLDIYTSDMTLYATLTGTQGARKILLRSDGSAMLISPDSARL